VLRDWSYQTGVISARLVRARDGREVLQMRIELGVLQMEVADRPDGQKPHGALTYLAWIERRAAKQGTGFTLSEDECLEIDREFLQYYHRRVCFLALREFGRAVTDADHTLALMDFVAAHSPDQQWTLSHEQYRPFVLFHRAQAATMVALEESGAEAAIEEVHRGLEAIRKVFTGQEAEEQFGQDELVGHLNELKETLRREYEVGPTLAEQLSEAIAAEEYERAARLRDEIAQRQKPKSA
jgi:hypothetical protein